MITRRAFLKVSAIAGAQVALRAGLGGVPASAAGRSVTSLSATTNASSIAGASSPPRTTVAARSIPAAPPLNPTSIPKYVTPLIIPPPMPMTSTVMDSDGKSVDYYEIAVRQFTQHILPPSMGLSPTTVWSYGSANHAGTFNYPAFTLEARYQRPVRVKWINGLIDENGHYLPHLLAVDQTLHWANPVGGVSGRDGRGTSQEPYTGPVPMVTHVHGAHAADDSDGYAEAWFLPAANDIPAGFAREGTWYERFKSQFSGKHGVSWQPGSATFQYGNDQRATTCWYHDHSVGMTRLNVYAGPAGFYLIRGGPDDQVTGVLPGPAPAADDPAGTAYHEIPIAIQDRDFDENGALSYPTNRAYFEGLDPDQLEIPFAPDEACAGPSDVPPIWNPEFFGHTMVVNGRTWPYLEVEPRRYRLRLLDGCNARYLILKLSNGLPFYQIGAEGGFLPAPVMLTQLLMSPAERADVIVDFTGIAVGTEIILQNIGPDEPFGGGLPGEEFEPADPQTTGQVMQFRVVAAVAADPSSPPTNLVLPARTALGAPSRTRKVSLNEMESETVFVKEENGKIELDCDSDTPFGPTLAALGTVNSAGEGEPLMWDEEVTEAPFLNSTEVWEIHNYTADAHPIHLHEVMFEVVNREDRTSHAVRGPELWETGTKDTVTAYPGEITRIKARFDLPGRYVWHCHIVEHEDNEMMRPYDVVPRKFWFPFAMSS